MHLKCCGDGVHRRKLQAERRVDWVDAQAKPVILIGDFNIPIPASNPAGLPTSAAFTKLTGAMTWLRPSNPTSTQVGGSVLDAVFHTASLNQWNPSAFILNANKNLADLEAAGFSDHRPIVTTWKIP